MQLGPVREYVPGDATHLDTRGSSAMAAGPANDRPIQPETLHTHVQLALESGHRDLIATRCALIAIAYAGLSVFNALSIPEPIVMAATSLTFGTAVVFAALAWFHFTYDYPLQYLNALAMLELPVLHIDALLFTALPQDVMNGLGLYVMVISTDIFLGSAAWIVGSVAALILT